MLIGLGFKPLEAAKLALIGNTAPVAFGSLGIPLVTLAHVTGLDLHQLSAMVGRQLPLFSLIVPFWLVAAQVGLAAAWSRSGRRASTAGAQLRDRAVRHEQLSTGRGSSTS